MRLCCRMSLESVLANLTAYGIAVPKACEAAMDQHIQRSVAFAKTNHRWQDNPPNDKQQTSGGATANIMAKTESKATEITSTIYGDIWTNLYLERAWFFNGRYAIIEQARNNNIWKLWAEIKTILGGGGLPGRFTSSTGFKEK